MQKMIALIAGLMMIGSFVPSAAALISAETQYLVVGEDFEGNFVQFYVTQSQLDHGGSCGGLAPVDPATCSTGSHVRGGAAVTHGVPACTLLPFTPPQFVSCYAGAVTSSLRHPSGARVFTCQLLPGPAIPQLNPVCGGTGTFPAIGAAFTHNCASGAYQGAVPAAGRWDCYITHS